MTMPKFIPRYIRKLSAIERYNLVINELDRYNVESIIEGVGELDLEQWQKAVAIAAEANPGTRVRLKSVLGFCKWVDSGISPVVELVSAPDWDGQSERGAEFMQEKFDVLKGGPIFDIKLIPGSPARIVFRGLHGAMDGRGLTHFIIDVFQVLRGDQPFGANDTVTDLDVRLQHQDKVKVKKRVSFKSIAVIPVKPVVNEPLRYIWRRLKLDKNVPKLLPKIAVFLASQARKHDSGDVVFTVTVDFRDLRIKANSTANLTGYIKIKVDPTDTPDDITRRIDEEIRDYADCFNPRYIKLLPWVPIWLLLKQLTKNAHELLYTTGKEMSSGGMGSLGYVVPEFITYPGFSPLSAVGIPPSVGRFNVFIHKYTDSDRTELMFSVPSAYNNEQQLDRLIAEISAEFG